ncbi:MAG: COG3014 family protein [Betaproteobacteria bacterium]
MIAPLPFLPATTRITAALLLAATLCGCATFRSYDTELNQTINLAASGNVDGAINQLERANKHGKKDLLYFFELGELERLRNRYEESRKAWMAADARVQAWERTAVTNPEKLVGNVASVLLNDKARPYEGRDYEKVMLTTRLALDQLSRDDFDSARVDIKRTHEREVVIAALREKELRKTEEEANKHGVKTSFKELNGYPVQTIDNPEVNALRNSYQSAFSHYLAGFVYEALGEPSLAAAGYRQAIELQPNQPLLEQALAGLDARAGARGKGGTDVLFVVESGTAPARKSQHFNLPIPYKDMMLIAPVSFPVIAPAQPAYLPGQLQIKGETPIDIVAITSIDLMARKALQEEMPGILLRGIIRSTAKSVAQYQAGKNDESGLAAFAIAMGSMITESADERGWRSLPAQIAVARARIPSGEHTITLQTPEGVRSVQMNLAGRYAVVGLRLLHNELFVQRPEAVAPGPGQQSADARAAPAPSTAGRPESLEWQLDTMETSK